VGSLAKWGAMAGLGSGMQDVATTKKEDRQMREKLTAEEARQMRIEKWRSGEEDRRAGEDRQHQLDLVDLESSQRQVDERVSRGFDAQQADLDRESRERVAMINATGRDGSRPDWMTKRFEPLKLALKDEFGAAIMEVAGTRDTKYGIPYAMIDGIWQAPPRFETKDGKPIMISTVKIPPTEVPQAAITELWDAVKAGDEDAGFEFMQETGWLPAWAMGRDGQGSTSSYR